MKDVKVYTTPTCVWCKKVKEYLKAKDIKFTEIDVTKDEDAAEKMIEKSGQMGVPQIEIDGKMIVGFDREALDEELK